MTDVHTEETTVSREFALTAGSMTPFTEDDWPLEQRLSRDREVVRRTLYSESMSEEDARRRCRRFVDRATRGESFRWVLRTTSGEPAGICGLAVLGGAAELFYALLEEFRGIGLATQAVSALADVADRLALEPRMVIEPENLASQRVAQRTGFTRTGDRDDVYGVHVDIWSRQA